MSSIIEGYSSDIFISYRQKDNKHDGWVTEFVNNLKGELESTFKEELSVYFDNNPHDGLLETHNVDASLKDKLKCLIFIPIISQTYCDPKSFAWLHEFVAFNNLAKGDQFGRDIKLTSGNVASRILPIKIHDLDPEDKTLLENELGGFIRGIEFIYKEPGVNRPLKPEDDEKKNLNNTIYRNQINKVANAVKEIINTLKKHDSQDQDVSKETTKANVGYPKNSRTKIIIGSVLILALIVLAYFFIPKLFKPSKQLEKSIAVLPFRNDTPNDSTTYFMNGVMEEILNNLQKISDFSRVLSRNSVEQFRNNTTKSTPEIAKKLNVNYIVEGSGQKYGNKFVLRVQLIVGNNEKHLWGKSYDREIRETSDIIRIQSEIAESIAAEMQSIITPEEKQLINKIPTTNLTAYDFYQRGEEESSKYSIDNTDRKALGKAEDFYHEALKHDSTFARAYVGLAWVYKIRKYKVSYLSESFLDSVLILVNKALSFDSQLSEAYTVRGNYYSERGLSEKAIEEFDKALKYNPNDYQAYYYKSMFYNVDLPDLVKCIDNMHKAVARNRGADLSKYLRDLAWNYLCAGFVDKAKYYYQEAYKLNRDSANYISDLSWVEWNSENFEDALKLAKKAIEIDSTRTIDMMDYYFLPSNYNEEAYICAKKWIEYYKKTGTLYLGWYYRYAIAFRRMGKYKEADYYFNQQIKYCEESIKLGREWAEYGGSYYDLAAIYAFLGDKVKAYKYLDEFDKIKSYPLWWMVLIRHDQFFDSIRGEEHFQKIQKNAEAKYQAEHERVRKWLEEQGML